MEQIDARGQACPLPVVRAKKALSAMGEGVLEVLVDNETAVHNLEALAKTLKVGAVGEERGEGVFAVTFAKGAASEDVYKRQPCAGGCGASPPERRTFGELLNDTQHFGTRVLVADKCAIISTVPKRHLLIGDGWVLVGPTAFKAAVRRAERLGCVRFAHISARNASAPIGALVVFPDRTCLLYTST